MRKGLSGLLLAAAGLIGLIAVAAAAIFLSLPDVRKLQGCLTTELYHVHLCKTDPGYVAFENISPHIIDAIIMSEDASFYSHQGVDLVEMKESFKKDWDEKRFARGASTITQQMVKNVFLSSNKSLLRKVEEVYLALQVEKVFTKKQILTFYLNVVEFGPDIYGVKGAAKYYFNKTPAEVTPEQAAFLAFLLPNPKKYMQSFKKGQLTPFAARTVNTILHRMLKSNRLTEEEFLAASGRVGSHLWHGEPPPSETSTNDGPSKEQKDTAVDTDLMESPTGIVEPPPDESNQENDDFQFEFNSDNN